MFLVLAPPPPRVALPRHLQGLLRVVGGLQLPQPVPRLRRRTGQRGEQDGGQRSGAELLGDDLLPAPAAHRRRLHPPVQARRDPVCLTQAHPRRAHHAPHLGRRVRRQRDRGGQGVPVHHVRVQHELYPGALRPLTLLPGSARPTQTVQAGDEVCAGEIGDFPHLLAEHRVRDLSLRRGAGNWRGRQGAAERAHLRRDDHRRAVHVARLPVEPLHGDGNQRYVQQHLARHIHRRRGVRYRPPVRAHVPGIRAARHRGWTHAQDPAQDARHDGPGDDERAQRGSGCRQGRRVRVEPGSKAREHYRA
mmetsp:Transcript_164/g.782  ORF Transcript_164/g.782 Transcript_164/m.782 type:complete len:305 (+) Transcript_164:402-1316(+)